MAYTDTQIDSIIEETLAKFQHQPARAGGTWLCDTAEEAIAQAKAAQKELVKLPLEKRGRLIEAMRKAALDHAEPLARLANEETGYGRVADKKAKNILAAEKTPGIEDLHAQAFTGDYGLTLVEAAPYGVIGSITPSTNPTSTVINNAISMIAAGNAVVFNPHPAAKCASQEAMRVLNEAIARAGGPATLITTVKEPTLESGKAMMESKDIPLLSVTGGEAVVKVAMRTGKKVIAAGPGKKERDAVSEAPTIDALGSDVLLDIDMVIGVIGRSVFLDRHMEAILLRGHQKTLLFVSGSTKTVEFTDLENYLQSLRDRENPKIGESRARVSVTSFRDLQTGVLQGYQASVDFPDDPSKNKILCLLGELMPINFLYYGIPREVVDEVMAQLFTVSCGLVKRQRSADPLPPKLLAVDREIDADAVPYEKSDAPP